jgi:glycine cleavage system transcriptional repressor
MNDFLVLTAIGEDRPGIIDQLSSLLLDTELNIEDSRMSVLGGEFAIILLLSGSASALHSLQQQQTKLEQTLNLSLLLKTTQQRRSKSRQTAYGIKVVGMDNPGIVHSLTGFLSAHKINIEDLQTEAYPAPHTGTPMFAVTMSVNIPAELDTGKLTEDFIALCDEQNLDTFFAPAK